MSVENSAGPTDTSDQLAPEQLAADRAELRRQLDELIQLGLRPCQFRDEASAPQVDERVLLRLIRRELPEETAALVYRLVYSYRTWHDAHNRLIREE